MLFILAVGESFAQLDTIVQKNGLRSPVKIVEINFDEVKFTVPGDPENKISSLKFNSIKMVITASGARINYDVTPEEHAKKKNEMMQGTGDTSVMTFRRNLAGINVTQLIFNTVGVSYQHIIKDGSLGIKIPFFYNLNPEIVGLGNVNEHDINPLYRKFTTGMEICLYPFYQKRFSYFIGPAFQVGMYDYLAANENNPYEMIRKTDGLHTSFIINNGALVRISENFYCDFSAGLGIQKDESHKAGEDIRVRGSFQFNVGYGF